MLKQWIYSETLCEMLHKKKREQSLVKTINSIDEWNWDNIIIYGQ